MSKFIACHPDDINFARLLYPSEEMPIFTDIYTPRGRVNIMDTNLSTLGQIHLFKLAHLSWLMPCTLS